jgi:DNA-binding SARP family transcriptional activator
MEGMVLRFRILGPLEVEQNGHALRLGGKQRQALLAVLLLHANEPVASEQLVEELWGDAPPDTATKIIQNNVSQLRKLLRPGVLLTRGRGYLLRAEPEELDARSFERLADEGREALARGDARTASATLREGLGLWRGPALADFVYEPFAQSEIGRLEELRLAASEDRIEADLALGRHADLVGELEALVVQHPLRERLRAHLMMALYRSGRQADALEVYKRTRQHLIDELGLEPGPALQRIERAVLAQDASLELAPTPNARAHVLAAEELPAAREPEREARKTASVLFTELLWPTSAIDPETLSALQSRVVESLSPALVRYGGAVEEVVPNGVMAVFGVPTTHEDDALRAVRAAADLRDALATLNEELERDGHPLLAIRTGVSTGTVVTGIRRTVTGEVVNAAAALAQAAQPGEILIGQETAQLIREAARLEPAESAPGRHAWRVLDLVVGAPAIPRHFETTMVGREREFAQLRQAFGRAVHDWTPHLFTVLGPPGIGKSRLAHELASSLAAEATVVTGHCLPYGEGITFWPLVEIVRQLAGENSRDGLVRLLAGEEDAEVVAERIAGAIGVVERASASEETFLAVRRLLEVVARERPLVLVLEDVHWAEPTLLDLVEHVVDWTRDAPVLLLCLARPELLEQRPAWGGGMVNATSILLEPLSDPESDTLIENLLESTTAEKPLEGAVRARIVDAAAGNPLFLEQMLALIAEEGAEGGELAVPPSIQALLAARLDHLPAGERTVLECASINGQEFWSDAVTELSSEAVRASVGDHLLMLVRRDLIRQVRPSPAGEGVYRFRHILIRDAAYESITKPIRAGLHERFADWLEGGVGERGSEREEIIGYHLEQAYRLRNELGSMGESGRTLAGRAADHLAAAGRRASARGDAPGAVNLLSRASRLMNEGAPDRPELMADLADALREAGDFTQAEKALAEVAEAATASGDRGLATYAHMTRLRLQVAADPSVDTEQLEREARRAVEVFEELGDERRLAKAWELLAWALWMRCQAGATEAALLQAIEHAQRAGDGRTEAQSLNLLLGAVFFGPLPVPEGIRRCQEIVARTAEQPRILSSALRALAGLRAMEGSFDEARTLLALCGAILEDLGLKVTAASLSETAAIIEMLAGDPAAAERSLRSGYAQLEQMGETSNSADLAAMLARALEAQGQADEALRFSEISSSIAAEDDLSPQVQWRSARAKALAGFGRTEEAETLAQEAVTLASQSDFLVLRGDALFVLGEVLLTAGRPRDAAAAVGQALKLYEQKQNTVSADQARRLLSGMA